MDCKSVIINLQDPAPSAEVPLLLRELLFCPVLTWICEELRAYGAERFFVICDDARRPEAQKALDPFSGAKIFSDPREAVASAHGETLVIPAAVVPLTSFSGTPVYAAEASDIDPANLSQAPKNAGRPLDWLPIGNEKDLLRAAVLCREAINARHASQGVTIIDPGTTYIDPRCRIGSGTTLLPGTILRGSTVIGADCEIGPNAVIRDCTIGDGTAVNASQLNESTVGRNVTVGPFAYIRPNCRIADGCRVGDFVEIKNSVLGRDTKVSHLTYVGDSDVGDEVNFGCGTVTTNYDGHKKYRCVIGDHAFLGCNTNLVAPVTVGDGAYTAAGSTVTEDVPADALAIARQRQSNKPGWAARFRQSWQKK